MIFVPQDAFVKAVQMAAEIASQGPTDDQKKIRMFTLDNGVQVMAAAGGLTCCRKVLFVSPTSDVFDVVVQGDRLLAAAKALRKGETRLELKEAAFRIEQQDGLEVELETGNVSMFPAVPAFDKMVHIYTGVNPVPGFEAIKHVASSHPGSTPLANVLILLHGRSYLAGSTSAVRCEFSLVGVENVPPIPLVLNSTWVLSHMTEPIACYDEPGRVLVMDANGWVTISKYGGDLGKFPETVERTFASLKQIGQVKVPRVEALRAASAAQTVLRGATKEAVYMTAECIETKLTFSANVGRHKYKETIAGWSSGHFKIPIHIGRFAEFLRGSEDEAVYIRVMDSDLIPSPLQFVHLVDGRLHEVVGLPAGFKVEVLKA